MKETLSVDKHSSSNHFNPASIAWLRKAAGKLDVSYAQTNVSSKSKTTYKHIFNFQTSLITTNSY